MSNVDTDPRLQDERANALDKFASNPNGGLVQAPSVAPMASHGDRVFGAQQVAVFRDEARILQKLAALGAAAGDDWFYRFPVKDKGATTFIEGPSIKLANDVARIYGNCEVDTRVIDMGTSWLIYARFIDYETGYALTRPFQQNKNASKLGGKDDDRRKDIAFQIGVSKAIRNVVSNALQTFADYAFNAARDSLVEKIGKELPKWRERTLAGLEKHDVEVQRVEYVIGRASKDWTAPDIAKIVAMMKAVADGMATLDETFPPKGEQINKETGEVEVETKTDIAKETATSTQSATSRDATNTSATGQADPKDSNPPKGTESKGSAKAAETKTASAANSDFVPTSEAQYVAYANAWIDKLTDADEGLARWKHADEKKLRNKCNVPEEVRDEIKSTLDKKVAEIKDADRS